MMTFNILLFFVREAVDSVVDSKDVLGVKRILHLSHKVDGRLWKDVLHESLADLSNTVMMSETATLLDDFFATFVFNLFINVNDLFFGNARVSVVVTEVHINGGTSLVDLGDSERNEETILLDASVRASLDQSFSYFSAKCANLAPRARSLERLSDIAILSSKVTYVSNGKS
jgi:hypothetical protein